jgi:hypothetical protein
MHVADCKAQEKNFKVLTMYLTRTTHRIYTPNRLVCRLYTLNATQPRGPHTPTQPTSNFAAYGDRYTLKRLFESNSPTEITLPLVLSSSFSLYLENDCHPPSDPRKENTVEQKRKRKTRRRSHKRKKKIGTGTRSRNLTTGEIFWGTSRSNNNRSRWTFLMLMKKKVLCSFFFFFYYSFQMPIQKSV